MRFIAPDIDVWFDDCRFEENRNPNQGFAGRGGVGAIVAGIPRFTNCYFGDNWGGIAGVFHVASVGAPVFENCVFENSGCTPGGWGGALVPEESSAGIWRNCVFRNNTCDYGGAVDDGGEARGHFINCTFEKNYGRGQGGAYYGFGNSRLRFTDCKFFGNRVSKGTNGQDFYLSSSVVIVFENCLFDAGEDSPMIADGASGCAKDNASLALINSVVRGYRAVQGAFHTSVKAHGTYESSVFQDNTAVKGAAIYSNRPITIRNCTFERNSATDGSALYVDGLLGSVMSVVGSTFRDNTATSAGGAIKATSMAILTIEQSAFVNNTAQASGGALAAANDASVKISDSLFTKNSAVVGGAIWSEGSLTITTSVFDTNDLHVGDNSVEDTCTVATGSGGAIYAALSNGLTVDTVTDGSTSVGVCSTEGLSLSHSTFRNNNAGVGGGGGVFIDRFVPSCVHSVDMVCSNCSFLNNTGAYGSDVGTVATGLILKNSSLSDRWELMQQFDIAIGATDALGQVLNGAHSPVLVRTKLMLRDPNSTQSLRVHLSSNVSRIIRNGQALFKAIALQLPVDQVNKEDTPLTLVFSADPSTSIAQAQDVGITPVVVNITLEKCEQELLNSDGRCLEEASAGHEQLVAGVVLAVVVGCCFAFVLYYAYRNTNRVIETLRSFVTGVGAIVLKFFFELVDMVSDTVALINLFLFDVSLRHPAFVRAAYVTCFVLSVVPSILLVRATFATMRAQWNRVNRKQATHALFFGASKRATSRKQRDHGAEKENAMQAVRPMADPHQFATAQVEQLEKELEYHRIRDTLYKRMLARMITEDFLLLILNIYIYAANFDDDKFVKSKFRAALEFSIIMSVVHLGSQGQAIVIWLQADKVNDVRDQLHTIRELHARFTVQPTSDLHPVALQVPSPAQE